MIRQYRLRKEYDQVKYRLSKGDHSVPLKKRSTFSFEGSEASKSKKPPVFVQTANSIKPKDLECNILHLMRLFDSLLKKKDSKVLIEQIKHYVLEEGSDLNELELCLEDTNTQLMVKTILFYERVLLIVLVESLITRKYKFC
jgi:hypothetical protein